MKKIDLQHFLLILALTLNLIVSLIIAGIIILGGMFQCVDDLNCNPNPGPYIYGTLAIIWGISPLAYLDRQNKQSKNN